MYVSVDRKAARFIHKHESVRVLCNLDFIRGVSCDVMPIDHSRFLSSYPETDLQRLYCNTTGSVDHSPHHGDALRNVLAELAARLPCTDADAWTADLQCKFLEHPPRENPPHVYRKGFSSPSRAPDEPVWPQVALTEEEAAIVARRRAAPAPLPAGDSGGVSVTATAPRPTRVVMPARQQGKTITIVFEVADRMWEAEGKPTRLDEVLALRKRMMDELEKVGIKRSTSSSALGAWQKARI